MVGWLTVEGWWVFVTADGSLTDASGVQLSPSTAAVVPSVFQVALKELKQIEEPITSLDMLKWIERSLDVAEFIRAKEKVRRDNCAQIEDL